MAQMASIELKWVEDLAKYAWLFRHPGAPYVPDREEAGEAMGVGSGFFRQ